MERYPALFYAPCQADAQYSIAPLPSTTTTACFLLPPALRCARSAMTFAVLRALYGIIGEALDDIERVYQSHGQEPLTESVAVNGDSDAELTARAVHLPSPSPTLTSNAAAYAATGSRHKHSLSSGSLTKICRAYASPPPSPCIKNGKEQRFDQRMPLAVPLTSSGFQGNLPSTKGGSTAPAKVGLDFPSLDAPFDASSASETLTSHPTVMAAINRIISACGQMTATVQAPFLTVCDSTMGVRRFFRYCWHALIDWGGVIIH